MNVKQLFSQNVPGLYIKQSSNKTINYSITIKFLTQKIIFFLVMFSTIGINYAVAGSLKYSNQCLNNATSTDIEFIENAFNEVEKHQHNIDQFIADSIARGNPDSYLFIDSNIMDDWREVVDKVANGDIKIACEFNPSSKKCRDNPLTLGWNAINYLNNPRVHICMDNIQNQAQIDNPTVAVENVYGASVSLLAGTLAHEFMHSAVRFEGHGGLFGGGTSNATNPQTVAESIGVAMDNLVLTPDLKATITSVNASLIGNDSYGGSDYDMSVNVKVENRNLYADIGLRSIQDAFANKGSRNGSSNLTLEIDGIVIDKKTVNPLGGLGLEIKNYQAIIPAYFAGGDGERNILASADSDNLYVESNELNNIDTGIYNTATDLSIGVEVAAPPVCYSEFRDDLEVPGWYTWFDIPYRVIVTNLDQEKSAPGVDLVMEYDSVMTSSSKTIQQVVWLTSFDPGESKEEFYSVEVPANSSCSLPLRQTQVVFTADGNNPSIHDSDLSNNSKIFTIDTGYWKADYVVRNITHIGIGYSPGSSSRVISYSIRNIGPTNASNGTNLAVSTTKVQAGNTSFFSDLTYGLDPGEEDQYQLNLPVDDCVSLLYIISADYHDTIVEYDENNNFSAIRLHPLTSVGFCPEIDNKQNYEADFAWIQQHGLDAMYDKLESIPGEEEWGTDRGR